MYIQLIHRHRGEHHLVKHTELSCEFSEIYLGENNIDEELLLKSIPEGWLPIGTEQILLAVGDRYGSRGQKHLDKFRSWFKYFDAYCLEIHKEPLDWWT